MMAVNTKWREWLPIALLVGWIFMVFAVPVLLAGLAIARLVGGE